VSGESSAWFRERRALVLGGTGFIGQHLVPALVRLGAHVTMLANSRPLSAELAALAESSPDALQVVGGSVGDPALMERLVQAQDVIYPLAGKSGAVQSNGDPLADLEINCRGLLNVLEAARVRNPAATIVYPSSRLVYGRATCLPVPETHETEPQSIYGAHKLASEKYLAIYHQVHRLPTVVLRISNPYGAEREPKQFTHGIVNHFVRTALRGEPLTIFGDGTQSRDYIYIDDVVEALLIAAVKPAAIGRVYNVGSGQPITLRGAADAVVQMVGSGQVMHRPWPPQDLLVETGDFVADIRRIQTELGWVPTVTWHEGLERILSTVAGTESKSESWRG
jgi:UDP-glucose 4-epimerase